MQIKPKVGSEGRLLRNNYAALYSRSGTYWIRLRSVGPCEARQLEQFAILNYLPVDSKAEANLLAFPQERIPQFAQTFGEGRVS